VVKSLAQPGRVTGRESCDLQRELSQHAIGVRAREFSDLAQQVPTQSTDSRSGRGLHSGVGRPQPLPRISVFSAGTMDKSSDKGPARHNHWIVDGFIGTIMSSRQGTSSRSGGPSTRTLRKNPRGVKISPSTTNLDCGGRA